MAGSAPVADSVRWVCAVEYLGEAGKGWQSQPGGCGIQDSFNDAVSTVAATDISPIVCAGRTDAGVHALGQVVHFSLNRRFDRSAKNWLLGINQHLPPTIRVRWVRRVPADFHARFSALRRTYSYLVWNDVVQPAFWSTRSALEGRLLDTHAMQKAAHMLCGEQDFAAFRAAGCSASTSVRQLHYLRVERRDRMVVFEICANAFLQRMVRIIVGCLMQVGRGQWQAQRLQQVLASKDRSQAAATAVAYGLYFLGPHYPPHFALPTPPSLASLLPFALNSAPNPLNVAR